MTGKIHKENLIKKKEINVINNSPLFRSDEIIIVSVVSVWREQWKPVESRIIKANRDTNRIFAMFIQSCK